MRLWRIASSGFLTKKGLLPKYLLGMVLLFLNPLAHADVWAYIDANGVTHFAPEQLDARYEVFFKGDETLAGAAQVPSATLQTPEARQTPPPAGTSRMVTYFEISPGAKAVKHHLREAARSQQIDVELLQAIIATESGFDRLAVSPKGAIGLMQLLPSTASRFGVVADAKTSIEQKLTDPHTNIRAGSRYLSYLLGLFPGPVELAVAAYNAGEGAVQRAGNRIPNFLETQNYVKTVMQLYQLLKPPAQLAQRRPASVTANGRIRVTMGGAINRNNMLPDPAALPTGPTLSLHSDNKLFP
jgi:hypothetical protein